MVYICFKKNAHAKCLTNRYSVSPMVQYCRHKHKPDENNELRSTQRNTHNDETMSPKLNKNYQQNMFIKRVI